LGQVVGRVGLAVDLLLGCYGLPSEHVLFFSYSYFLFYVPILYSWFEFKFEFVSVLQVLLVCITQGFVQDTANTLVVY
jgi:hypothetical protein